MNSFVDDTNASCFSPHDDTPPDDCPFQPGQRVRVVGNVTHISYLSKRTGVVICEKIYGSWYRPHHLSRWYVWVRLDGATAGVPTIFSANQLEKVDV